MERLLVETIAKENNFTIITKLDDSTKQYLKEHIQNFILDKNKYPHLEYLNAMIDEAIKWFEDELLAINYIKSINYTINNGYYQKLEEEYFDNKDASICDWEDEYEKPKKNIRLNQYSLTDFITLTYVDGIDLMVDEFYNSDVWKKNTHIESFKEGIDESLKIHFNHKNRVIDTSKKSVDEAIKNMLNSEPINADNIKIKEVTEPLSKRETNLITADVILILNKGLRLVYKEKIANDYNINSNTSETNQNLLNNSYDIIIDYLENLSNTKNIISLLENEKSINNDLFTNGKKLSKVKSNNHYMSFLYKCNSVYSNNDLIVFQEFVEALLSGYIQYLEFEDKEQKIKSYKQDLEVLKRYNISNENDKNIQYLEDNINFLSIPKPHQKFIPFKELSNRLEIDTKQISNYIINILNNGTHKNTIKLHFDTLRTIPKEICISIF